MTVDFLTSEEKKYWFKQYWSKQHVKEMKRSRLNKNSDNASTGDKVVKCLELNYYSWLRTQSRTVTASTLIIKILFTPIVPNFVLL